MADLPTTSHAHGAGRSTPSAPTSSNPISRYLHQVLTEMRKVVWPTRDELATYTTVVIVFVLAIMAYVFVLDQGFTRLVEFVFGN